jgi:hypothetical protein
LSNSVTNATAQKDENKDIFNAADFPGLGGGMKSPSNGHESGNLGQKNEGTKLSGYADALLKKGGKDKDAESYSTKETEKSEGDSITRQTEAMEREILSDFHDLRIIGDPDNQTSGENNGRAEEKEETSSPSKKVFDHLPILPGMSDIEIDQTFSLDAGPKPAQSSVLHPPSNSQEQGDSTQQAPVTEQPAAEEEPSHAATPTPNSTPTDNDQDKPASSSGAWGSRRLFSDVSSSMLIC